VRTETSRTVRADLERMGGFLGSWGRNGRTI
jgi:hypothetical protein